jgi:hypothetical protein
MNPIEKISHKDTKLVMTILAKNESDIIRQNIEFHLKHGVDFIIATDNASTDGTREIFREYEKKGKIFLIDEAGRNKDQKNWVARMGEVAIERFGADIVVHNDADEFWVPASGSLKDDFLAHADADVFVVERVNVILENRDGKESFPKDTKYVVVNPIRSENVQQESREQNIYYFKLGPKIAFMTSIGNVRVIQGNHAIEDSGKQIRQRSINNITIYHFPVRSRKNFWKKVEQNGAAVGRNTGLAGGASWHIRRWYEAYNDGPLEKEYNKLTIARKEAEELLVRGVIKEIDFNEIIN